MSLSIFAASGYDTLFPAYSDVRVSPVQASENVTRGAEATTSTTSGGKVGKSECQTCQNRKYVDGSNENDVSFKTPGHIAPENSASQVMAHEQEHVSNAIAEGNKPNKQLLSATVTLHTSVCPECGRVYVSGGTTHTRIRTTESSNPYDQRQRDMNRALLAGMNFDKTA